MSRTETVIEGTIQPDGSLVLDQKPNLPPGRMTNFIWMMEGILSGEDKNFVREISEIDLHAVPVAVSAAWANWDVCNMKSSRR